MGQHGVVGPLGDPFIILLLRHHPKSQRREGAHMGRVGPPSIVPEMRHMNFDHALWGNDPVKLAHHMGESLEVGTDVLQHMLHQNVVEAVVRQWPWCLLNVELNVGRTFSKVICIHKAFALVKAAAEVEFSHGKCAAAS